MSAFLLLFVLSTFGLDWKHRISQRSKEMNSADRRNLENDYYDQQNMRVAALVDYYSDYIEQDPAVAVALINHYLDTLDSPEYRSYQDFSLWRFPFWEIYSKALVAFPTFVSSSEFQHLQTDTFRDSALGIGNLEQDVPGNLDQVFQALQEEEPEIATSEPTAADTAGIAPIGESFGSVSAVENAQCAQFDDTCACTLFGHFLHCVDCECKVFEELFEHMDDPDHSMTELLDDDYCHETDSHCECHLGVEESMTDESVLTAAVTCVNCSCEEFTSLLGVDRRNLQETNSLKEEPKMLKRSNVLRKL